MTEQPNEAGPHPEQPQSPAPHPQSAYGPGPYVQQPYGPGPYPPPRSSKDGLMRAATWGIWTWVAVTVVPLVLVLLCCVGCFGAGILGSADTEGTAGGESTPVAGGRTPSPGASSAPSRDATPSASAKPAEKKPEPKVPGIGDKARDGKFEFVVRSVECGRTTVGSGFLEEKAQGQFCLVSLRVENIGKEPRSFSDSNQKAYAADGSEYSSDSGAGLVANQDGFVIYEEINPGNKINAVVVFDVPKKVKLTKVKLHDSFWSGGVTVELK